MDKLNEIIAEHYTFVEADGPEFTQKLRRALADKSHHSVIGIFNVLQAHVVTDESDDATELELTDSFEKAMIDFAYRLTRAELINRDQFYYIVDMVKCY